MRGNETTGKKVYICIQEKKKKRKEKRFALLFTHHITKVKPPDCCLALKHSHSRSQLMQVVERRYPNIENQNECVSLLQVYLPAWTMCVYNI